jgi:hypothetical protein
MAELNTPIMYIFTISFLILSLIYALIFVYSLYRMKILISQKQTQKDIVNKVFIYGICLCCAVQAFLSVIFLIHCIGVI